MPDLLTLDRLSAGYGEAKVLHDLSLRLGQGEALALLGEALYAAGNSRRAQLYWAEAASTYPLAPSLALLQAKKHLWRGEQETAAMLLSETVAMAPGSAQAEEARSLLGGTPAKR